MRLLILAVILLLAGCASTPEVGPCYVDACEVTCCNNDGRVCPICWEEKE